MTRLIADFLLISRGSRRRATTSAQLQKTVLLDYGRFRPYHAPPPQYHPITAQRHPTQAGAICEHLNALLDNALHALSPLAARANPGAFLAYPYYTSNGTAAKSGVYATVSLCSARAAYCQHRLWKEA